MIAPMTQADSLGLSNNKVPPFYFQARPLRSGRRRAGLRQEAPKPAGFLSSGRLKSLRHIAEALHLLAVIRNDLRDVLVPMVIEEPSVVAGASYAAKLVRAGGGFREHRDHAHFDRAGDHRA